MLASGLCEPTGSEVALKIAEAARIPTESYAALELLHGSLAMVDARTEVLIAEGDGATDTDAEAVRPRLERLGVHPLVLRSGCGPLSPERLPALAAPFVATVRDQQLARALAVARGLDPDRPHNLAKVTLAGEGALSATTLGRRGSIGLSECAISDSSSGGSGGMQLHVTSERTTRYRAGARPTRHPVSSETGGRRRPRRGRLVAALLAGGLALSACSSHPSVSTTTTATGRATPVAGGTAYFAEQPNSAAFYTFPLTPPNIGSLYTITQFQNLLWRPLYWFGNNGAPTMNPARSLAFPPTYLDGGRAVAIRLKAWHFSNGSPVTAGDVVFWLNLLKAEKDNWSAYVPGDFPDNVTSATVVNPRMLVLHLNGPYGANWFTDNELSQLIPLPAASWDRSGPTTAGTCSTTTVSTAGCAAVYRYLIHEAGLYASYATNPLWKVVDGPWEITSFQNDGYLELSPNPDYPGSKPHLAHLVEEPFTSPTAEVNELLAGQVDYGYLPPADVALEGRLAALGYRVVPTYSWSVNFIPINFNNPTVGVLFHQLYLRQAMQELINQPGFITAAFHGAAALDDGPVPLRPANPYVSSLERRNPYPYDPTAAAATLRAHGWSVRPDATSSCARPGDGPSDCGAGIKAGTPLSFSLDYYNGQPGLDTEMTFLRSSFAQVGIALAIKGEPLPTLNASYFKCSPHQAGCTWQMVQGGLSWTFLPDYYPTSAEFLSSTGSSNSGSYASATADRLIEASHTGSLSALLAAEDYLAKNLPVLWLPVPATLTVVRDTLGGTEPGDPFFGLYASQWYFTR